MMATEVIEANQVIYSFKITMTMLLIESIQGMEGKKIRGIMQVIGTAQAIKDMQVKYDTYSIEAK